jgi:hypothetical protein
VGTGTTWTPSFLPTDFLNNLFGAQSGNVWTSGYDGTVLHKAGASSTLQLVSAVSHKSHKDSGRLRHQPFADRHAWSGMP